MSRTKRRRGMRLDDYIVERLPTKRKQYTVWDLTVQGCGVRISGNSKSNGSACRIAVTAEILRLNTEHLETLTRNDPTNNRLRKPLIRIFGVRETPRGKRARVAPHNLRRSVAVSGAAL